MYFLFYFIRLAFSYLKDYHKALSCYKKACELDPDNVGYQRNYRLTLNNLQEASGPTSQSLNDPITVTPNLRETAASIITDMPEVPSEYATILY